MTYREEKLFLELDLNQEFRKGGAYLLPPVKYTNSASWLCQECSKIQGLDATTATGLLPLIESKCSWVVGAWSTITLGALVNLLQVPGLIPSVPMPFPGLGIYLAEAALEATLT